MNRREFLKASATAAAYALASPAVRASSPTKKYRTVLIGSGWWGMNICGEAIASGACEVSALCDVDSRILGPAAGKVEKLTGSAPKTYRDFRELLDRRDIDAVSRPVRCADRRETRPTTVAARTVLTCIRGE